MNSNNLEENLKEIRLKGVSAETKNVLWARITLLKSDEEKKIFLLPIFNLKKYMIGALIALMVILGGGGAVVASNNAVPGDALYGLDLAVEKAKINFAGESEKKNELRIKFAEERVAEAKAKSHSEDNDSVDTSTVDLSTATITEIEADVFTNETTVKIEANDKHYGFVTAKKTKADVVAEIASKYNLTVAQVEAIIDFETEDRVSRPEDKGFLNGENSIEIKSEKEKHDFEMSLQSLSDMEGLSAEAQAKLNAAINEIRLILEANPNSKIKIENGDFKLEVKENGMVKFKSDDDGKDNDDSDDDSKDGEDGDDDKGHGNDDDGEDEDNPGKSTGVNVNVGAGIKIGDDKKENDDEVYCRGEWRDAEDCDDNDSEDTDDNSGNDDEDNDNDDDSDEDEDNDNSGGGSDDDNDDDNSGHGNDEDND